MPDIAMRPSASDEQARVIAFLSSAEAYLPPPPLIERHETHGALVFLANDEAYKIKRAVRYAYMDFSTLAQRRKAVEREIEVNQPLAPDIYLGAVAITRERNGQLKLGGEGPPVEWAVHMRRFQQSDLLSSLADRNALTPALARELADRVFNSHGSAARAFEPEAEARMLRVVSGLSVSLSKLGFTCEAFRNEAFVALAMRQLHRAGPCLRRRGDAGLVRRCHGDLHLNNVVLWKGVPTLFDAIEFDEDLATIDTLYDLAFLLMDLDQRGHRPIANAVLNRYLWRSGAGLDIEGLVALPLFLGVRSAVRGLVAAQRAQLKPDSARMGELDEARSYLSAALLYLSPAAPRLLAIGGLSGTGKTTLAAALAPDLKPAPGAFHIRTDLERKSMLGVAETDRLPPSFYTREMSENVYHRVHTKARLALAAGHSVVVDAVSSSPQERAAIEQLAVELRAPFTGLWLTTERATMLARIAARTHDASDATADVVEQQLRYDIGQMSWHRLDAGGSLEATRRAAQDILAGSA